MSKLVDYMLRFMARIFCLYFFLFFYQCPLVAQEKLKPVYFKHIEYKDGLPSNNILEAISDERNGLWFRSDKEVIFYNSNDFLIFSSNSNLFKISNPLISCFFYQDDKIYVFGPKGIDLINCKTKKAEVLLSDTLTLDIRGGCVTKDGDIVFVSSKGGVYRWKKNVLKLIGKLNFIYDCCIKVNSDGDVFVSNNATELLFFPKGFMSYKQLSIPNDELLLYNSLYADDHYGLLVVTQRNIYSFDKGSDKFSLTKDSLPSGRLLGITAKYLYVVSGFNNLQQIDRISREKKTISIPLNNPIFRYYINNVIICNNSLGVLCTNQGVIFFQQPVSFVKILPEVKNRKINDIGTRRALVELDGNKILQVHYKGFDLYDPKWGINKSFLNNELLGYAAERSGDDVWLGMDGIGLYRLNLKTKRATSTAIKYDTLQQRALHVTAVKKINDSSLLIGLTTGKTLVVYNPKSNTAKSLDFAKYLKKPFDKKVTDIQIDQYKRIWICSDTGVLLLNNKLQLVAHYDRKIISENIVNNIYCPARDIIWLATANGLIKFDLKNTKVIEKYNVDNGLAGNRCIAILPDKFGTLWIPTYTGLSRFDPSLKKIWNYYMQDGFADNEYNFKSHLVTKSGDIYLGGLNGYVHITPDNPVNVKNYNYSLIVDYVIKKTAEGSKLLDLNMTKSVKIHARNDKLSVSFSVPDYIYSEYTTYGYLLEGLHKDWTLLNRQGKIELSALAPGKYSLLIQAKDPHGRIIFNSLALKLVVYEYWYESKLFYFFSGSFLLFAILGFIYIKFNSLKKISKIRADLSRDIHDEVGSFLTAAIQKLQILKLKPGSSRSEIESVEQNLRDGIQSFRNILWSLNDENEKIENLIGRINQLLEYVFKNSGFNYLVSNYSTDLYFKQSSNTKRNLLLIIKELATNTLKHSSGNFFEIVFRTRNGYWEIKIADNGINQNTIIDKSGLKKSVVNWNFEKKKLAFLLQLNLKNECTSCYY